MFFRTALLLTLLLCASLVPSAQQRQTLTHKLLRDALSAKPSGEAANQLAAQVRDWFGKEEILKGARPKINGPEVAWAIEAPGTSGTVNVISQDGSFRQGLVRIGTSDVYTASIEFPKETVMRTVYEVDGKKMGAVADVEAYPFHPDAVEKPGVPKGKLTQMPLWKSKIFPDTERDWWVYVPAQYKPDNPACVMVFQDGGGMKNYVPVVLDNLIAQGDMPVTVGIFINPGGRPGDARPYNRSFEYDTLSDQYARFLLEEILPEVEKTLKLRHDAASRAISGLSSGGICSFTVAWERPNEFSKVLSFIGSFTNIASGKTLREGGHNYPALIRKTPKKPIRVFLQDGENDLDNAHGNWPLANQQMAKALAYAGYDYKLVFGRGHHNALHARAILPDALRWLWRDYKKDQSDK